MGEQGIDRAAGQTQAGQPGGKQEIAPDHGRIVAGDAGAGGIAEGQGEQEKADGRGGNDNRTADVGQQAA